MSCVFYVENKVQYRRQRATFTDRIGNMHEHTRAPAHPHVYSSAKIRENCRFETPEQKQTPLRKNRKKEKRFRGTNFYVFLRNLISKVEEKWQNET